ncbi:MAG: sugar phosphate isomerase/epimerase [Treponema sp.]|jgi:sugar phosphate isomerase/epimerase|nr:sugar phosphate isomerase/epimerase [Treponema sp.]
MSNKSTWRLGFVGFIYTPPKNITDPIEELKWHMSKTQELTGGPGATQYAMPYNWTDKVLNELKEHMVKTDNELELGVPIFGSFVQPDGSSLISGNKEEIRKTVEAQIRAAKFLGVKILRSAYGKLKLKWTRFNKDYPLKDHIKFVTDNLKEAKKIFEDNDVYLALENHCDFTGKEFAEIYAEVNSRHIGCTLDTANGYTVYCDPNEEIELLATYAVTTHIKDMLVQDFTSDYGLLPFQARGCAVGDGNVDIPRALDLLDQKSPFSKGLHLVIEQGWMNYDNIPKDEEARAAYDKECVHKGLKYLKGLLGRA